MFSGIFFFFLKKSHNGVDWNNNSSFKTSLVFYILYYKITEIVRVIWLVKNLWFIKPIEKGIRTTSHKQNLQTTILERLKKQNKLLTQPF